MMARKGKIYVGTSGWHYKHWIGTFYPVDTADKNQLAYYQQHFSTVEINNSFYNLPSVKTFDNWRNATPKDFVFSVKGSRFFTHMKKLNVTKADMVKFFRRVDRLKEKLGTILFQLPPGWKVNTERLETFITRLPPHHRYIFEFRNDSWYTDEVYNILSKYNCAFCIYELAGHSTPMLVTADFVYIRLHGPTQQKYQGSYTTTTLKKWASRCIGWTNKGKDVYIYFDNDQAGYAAFNAETLLGLLDINSR